MVLNLFRFKEVQNALQPKKKFGFKGKKSKSTAAPKSEESNEKSKSEDSKVGFDQEDIGFQLRNKYDEDIKVSRDEVNKKDVLLSNLTGCRIQILGNPSTLHMTSIKNCAIECGPVSTSVFIDECTNSEFHLACQQLR